MMNGHLNEFNTVNIIDVDKLCKKNFIAGAITASILIWYYGKLKKKSEEKETDEE